MRPDALETRDAPSPPAVERERRVELPPSIVPFGEPDRTNNEFPREGCGALVLGGSHGALAVVRSVGRHGIPVWFASDDNVLARFSRFTRKGLAWPGPNAAGAAA